MRIPLYFLRNRRLRRDALGVVLAAREIGEVGLIVAIAVVLSAWAGHGLFREAYQPSSSPSNVNVDLSTFPRACESLLVNSKSQRMLPALNLVCSPKRLLANGN